MMRRTTATKTRKTRVQLEREVRALQNQVGKLKAIAAAHRRAEGERRRLLHHFGERVKELTALHRAVRLLQDSAQLPSAVLEQIVALLPPAWQYPDVTEARITFDGLTFSTPNFRVTPWRQEAALVTSDGKRGAIEVVYLREQPPEAEGPFLAEERDLINSLADSLTSYLNRKRAEEALRNAHNRLQALSQQLLQVQEQERRRLARDLHDEIGQALTAVKMNLQAMERGMDTSSIDAWVGDAKATIDRMLERVRDLSLDLRPSLLDDLGLGPAVRWYVGRQAERAALECDVVLDGIPSDLPGDVVIGCFRVIQEALTNILRHARATKVRVTLEARGDELFLSIEDDGKGFRVSAALDRASKGHSMGLLGMQERVTYLDGTLTVDSTPGRGTTIHARIPLRRESRNDR